MAVNFDPNVTAKKNPAPQNSGIVLINPAENTSIFTNNGQKGGIPQSAQGQSPNSIFPGMGVNPQQGNNDPFQGNAANPQDGEKKTLLDIIKMLVKELVKDDDDSKKSNDKDDKKAKNTDHGKKTKSKNKTQESDKDKALIKIIEKLIEKLGGSEKSGDSKKCQNTGGQNATLA